MNPRYISQVESFMMLKKVSSLTKGVIVKIISGIIFTKLAKAASASYLN